MPILVKLYRAANVRLLDLLMVEYSTMCRPFREDLLQFFSKNFLHTFLGYFGHFPSFVSLFEVVLSVLTEYIDQQTSFSLKIININIQVFTNLLKSNLGFVFSIKSPKIFKSEIQDA